MISGCSQGSHIFEVVFIRDRRQATFTIVAEVKGYFFLFSQCPCQCDELSRLDYQPLFRKMSPHSPPPPPGWIKDRTRETAEIEPMNCPKQATPSVGGVLGQQHSTHRQRTQKTENWGLRCRHLLSPSRAPLGPRASLLSGRLPAQP